MANKYITTNRFVGMEKKVSNLTTKMEEHCDRNEEHFFNVEHSINELKTEMKDFIDKSPNRFASKRTEQLFYSTLGAGIVYILYAVFKHLGI
ncbi:MAG: hypothetical protein BWY74_00778 [Firmicutes bacterium ADurb.Bin419]|nr:MAG: hypothetical protein BWY74_00778 [Firmicutes bacterium ADurb.Bin419]